MNHHPLIKHQDETDVEEPKISSKKIRIAVCTFTTMTPLLIDMQFLLLTLCAMIHKSNTIL